MTVLKKNKGGKIRGIYGIFLGAWTSLVGVLFIIQIWRIYALGDTPYSSESVSKAFSEIAVPVWIWLAAALGGGVLSFVFPSEKEKISAYIDNRQTLSRLQSRLPEEEGTWNTLRKQQNTTRFTVWGVCGALLLTATIVCIVFLLDTSYVSKLDSEFFQTHKEAEILLLRCLPWIIAALFVAIGATYYDAYVTNKQITLVKNRIAENAKKGVKLVPAAAKTEKTRFWQSEKFLFWTRVGFAVCAVGLVIFGVANGGMNDVFEKAIRLCRQCIGLG